MRIVFVCFPPAEGCWTPAAAERGIGGSEEAVIQLAARLAETGHSVSVHMRRGADQLLGRVFYGSLDNVPRDVDVAVVWRRAALIDQLADRGVRAGRAYLWLHDVVSHETLARYHNRYHKVMVVSRYHRSRYPQLAADRFFVTSNGIDPGQFEPPNPLRDPFQIVYGSDYCRGLRTLLTSWPTIRQAAPTAKLNVFYGWQGIDRHNPQRSAQMRRVFGPLFRQPGVTHYGRISHTAVAEQFQRAGVWAYPCSFRETSCITAMKAQAGGAVPAVIPNGALRETVRFGFRTARNYDDLGGTCGDALVDEWRTGLIELLRSPERQLRIRRAMVPACKAAFDWAKVAAAWAGEFSSD